MAIGTGLSTQYGMKTESVYGTPVTVDNFTYINSEGITPDVQKIESPFLGTTVMRTSQVKTVLRSLGGDIEYPFFNKGMGRLLYHCFGAKAAAQIGVTPEYAHTFTLDIVNAKTGLSSSVQVGRPSVDGTVRPFSWEGGKVVSFEVSIEADGLLTLTVTWDFENELTATALASASYITNLSMFDYSTSSVTWGGSNIFVNKMSIKVDWTLATDRFGLAVTQHKEPIANGLVSVTGSMEGEFTDLSAYNDFIAGTQRQLVWTNTGATIPTTANPYKVVSTLPAVEFTGEAPQVGGPEIVMQTLPFRALYNGSANPFTMVVNTDEVSYT